jgi:hypothetical protein
MTKINLYVINHNQVKCVNILIAILEEAVKRNTFTAEERLKIDKSVNVLCNN